MTVEGGLALMIIGALSLLWSVTERVSAHRRWLASTVETVLNPALREAFPPPQPARDLERLVIEAGSVVESRDLIRQRRRWSRRQRKTARGR